jgi:hypothetical protein
MIDPADQTTTDVHEPGVGGVGGASSQGNPDTQKYRAGRSPRYFLQRQGRRWREVDEFGWVQAERETGFGLHGVISPITAGFSGISKLTGQTVRGRLVFDIFAIVGSRRWHDNPGGLERAQEIIEARLAYGHHGLGLRPDAVVSGHAVGVDRLAEDVAAALDLVVIRHLPQHRVPYDPSVYFERNTLIAQDATRGLCIISKTATTHGADDTVKKMRRMGKPVERIVI